MKKRLGLEELSEEQQALLDAYANAAFQYHRLTNPNASITREEYMTNFRKDFLGNSPDWKNIESRTASLKKSTTFAAKLKTFPRTLYEMPLLTVPRR